MGLFTNRKRDDDTVVPSSEAIEGAVPSWVDDAPPPTGDPITAPDATPGPLHEDGFRFTSPEAIPDRAEPFADDTSVAPDSDGDAERALADHGTTLAERDPETPPDPRHSLTEQPGTVQVGNVEIDAHGLLEMLGVTPDASLQEISSARLRFVAEHDPSAEDDPDAARIKERIRREVNTAYASFRLTRGD